MVGVPGKSKGCNTCRRRKKGVRHTSSHVALANFESVISYAPSVDSVPMVDMNVEAMLENESSSSTLRVELQSRRFSCRV